MRIVGIEVDRGRRWKASKLVQNARYIAILAGRPARKTIHDDKSKLHNPDNLPIYTASETNKNEEGFPAAVLTVNRKSWSSGREASSEQASPRFPQIRGSRTLYPFPLSSEIRLHVPSLYLALFTPSVADPFTHVLFITPGGCRVEARIRDEPARLLTRKTIRGDGTSIGAERSR